jgi:Ca2+/Na+ antiporter
MLGAFIALGLIITKHKPIKYKNSLMFEFGISWGGLCLGPFLFVNKFASNKLKQHEYGHSIQNLIFGPLFLFIVGIPSLCRFHFFKKNTDIHRADSVVIVILICFVIVFITAVLGLVLNYNPLLITCAVSYLYSLFICEEQCRLFISFKRNKNNPPEYEDIWFEKQATKLGK